MMIKPLLWLAAFSSLPLTTFAETDIFTQETYPERKHEILRQVDDCDFINAKEIMLLSSIPIQILDADISNIKDLFKNTKKKRTTCFNEALSSLDDLIGLTERHLKKNDDLLLSYQNSLDNQLLSMLKQRADVTNALLESILTDIETSVASIPVDGPSLPTPEEKKESYYQESAKTQQLVKIDMTLVLEMERRQHVLDQLALTFKDKISLSAHAANKITTAHHHLSRGLLVFEDVYTQPALVSLARLNSEISYATLQLNEIMATNPNLDGLTPEQQSDFAMLFRKSRDLQRDISGAYDDIVENIFTSDFSAWLSILYDDLSELGYRMQNLRASLLQKVAPPAPQSAAEFVDQMLLEIQKMAAEEEIAAQISTTVPTEDVSNTQESTNPILEKQSESESTRVEEIKEMDELPHHPPQPEPQPITEVDVEVPVSVQLGVPDLELKPAFRKVPAPLDHQKALDISPQDTAPQ